jgi:hypothetical protein
MKQLRIKVIVGLISLFSMSCFIYLNTRSSNPITFGQHNYQNVDQEISEIESQESNTGDHGTAALAFIFKAILLSQR